MSSRPPPYSKDLPPLTREQLKALFDYLDRQDPEPCTHSFKETVEVLSRIGVAIGPVVEWLGRNGAGCDCEVIYNVEEKWGEYAGRSPPSDADE